MVEKKTFYEPYAVLIGAAIPIPNAVMKVAQKLNGKTMTLRKALAKLRKITDGELTVVEGAILLRSKGSLEKLVTHCWRVIKYR